MMKEPLYLWEEASVVEFLHAFVRKPIKDMVVRLGGMVGYEERYGNDRALR